MNSQTNKNVEAIKQKIEDYYSTILALLSFVGLTTWKNGGNVPGANFTFGRRMETSPSNMISPNAKITPDAVIQPYFNLGYVVEAKKSLPNSRQEWDKYIQQLIKYDDDLIGWWTDDEFVSDHCTVLLIEISRSVEFSDYLAQYLSVNGLSFKKPFSVVMFSRADEFKHYYILRTETGDILDDDLRENLRKGKKINIENVVGTYGDRKFYDTEPEPEFTMQVLWMDIFNEMARNVVFNKNIKAYLLEVDINDMTKELQRLYGSTGSKHREAQFPKKAWVQKAFDGFVRLDLAEVISHDKYRVFFKQIRGDILEKFSKQRQNSKTKKLSDDGKQLTFLDNQNSMNNGE